MKKQILLFILLVASVACNNSGKKTVTYQDAENCFISELTQQDTACVLAMTSAFMDLLVCGKVDSAVQQINVLDGGVLFKSSQKYLNELKERFSCFPVKDYQLVRYSFSTEGNNDVCYRYQFDAQHSMKIVFNPVKIDGLWYLTMKDGYQSSMDLDEKNRVHPLSPAPDKVVLNTRN